MQAIILERWRLKWNKIVNCLWISKSYHPSTESQNTISIHLQKCTLQALSNYTLLMQNVYLLAFMITEQIKMMRNVFTLNIHYKISSKYKTSVLNTRLCTQLILKFFFSLFLLMKAWNFQDNTVHSKNCVETLKINGPVTIFRHCCFLLSLMLSQFWGDLAVCVFLWDICNQPPRKLSQKQTESCSWVSTRLSRENIQFSHPLYVTKGGRMSLDCTMT